MEPNENKIMILTILIISVLSVGGVIYRLVNSPEKINLTDYETKLIDYYKEVALDAEFGDSPNRIVKWNSIMKLYIEKDREYKEQVTWIKEVINKINSLVKKSDFKIEITGDKSKSNSIIFLGNRNNLEINDPSFFNGVDMEVTGLVNIEFDTRKFAIMQSKIFISTDEQLEIQFSTILEELTQSIGLPADSNSYSDSIFYENQIEDDKINNDYSQLDIDIIKLLYHPKMKSGYNTIQVNSVFKRILKSEPNLFFNIDNGNEADSNRSE